MKQKQNWVPKYAQVDFTKIRENSSDPLEDIFYDFNIFLDAVVEYSKIVITECEEGNYKREYEDTILIYLKDIDISFLGKVTELVLPLSGLKKCLNSCLKYYIKSEEYEKCSEIQKLLDRYSKLDKSKF